MKTLIKRLITAAIHLSPDFSKRIANLILHEIQKKHTTSSTPINKTASHLEIDLAALPETVTSAQIITLLSEYGLLDEEKYKTYMSILFSERKITTLESILNAQTPQNADTNIVFKIRLDHYKGIINQENTIEISKIINKTDQKSPIKLLAEATAITQFILSEDTSSIKKHLDQNNPQHIRKISKTNLKGICHLLIKNGEIELAKKTLQDHLSSRKEIEKFYFLDISRDINTALKGSNENETLQCWQSVSTSFLSILSKENPTLANGLAEKLKSASTHILTSKDLLDARYRNDQLELVKKLISSSLCHQEPISLIRVGDGEAYCLPHQEIFGQDLELSKFNNDNTARELHWWGKSPNEQTAAEIKQEVLSAINSASIIGIPWIYRVIRDISPNDDSLTNNRAQRGLFTAICSLGKQLQINDKYVVEERIHQFLFRKDYLQSLFNIAKHVVIVSCWSQDELIDITPINATIIKIPPHTKVRTCTNQQSLFENYKEISKKIDEESAPGVLVLVGAGLIGKIFIQRAHRKGAVALDIGSVLDYYAGRKTRSVGDHVVT